MGANFGDLVRSHIFVPAWNLNNDSRMSVDANAVEFARHAFPFVVVADMEAMGSSSLSHNMSYAAAQPMFYLVAGARRIQLLGDIEAVNAGCDVHEVGLRCQISELGNDIQGLE